MKPVWVAIISILVSGMVAWGGWITVSSAGHTPREVHDDAITRIEDKIDAIKDLIIELHKKK
jgi:hypothetical protein